MVYRGLFRCPFPRFIGGSLSGKYGEGNQELVIADRLGRLRFPPKHLKPMRKESDITDREGRKRYIRLLWDRKKLKNLPRHTRQDLQETGV